MRAHLVQLDIAWEDPVENFSRTDRLLDTADIEPGDLVVLPELFSVGFSLNTETTADKGGQTLRYLLRLADDLGVTIQGGRCVHDCDCALAINEATIVAPGSDHDDADARLIAQYAKLHPFTAGREPERFSPGDRVHTYDWQSQGGSLRVCPGICYDLRFPELFRQGLAMGAEVFALGANWPSPRHAHWRALLIARAIENQALVLGVNRVGSDPHLNYLGGTIAGGAQCEVLGVVGAEPGVLSVQVDPGAIRGWREAFPAWKDTHPDLVRSSPRLPTNNAKTR